MTILVHDARYDHIQHGVGGADTQEQQGQEEEYSPEICTRHGNNGSWVGEEADFEGTQSWGIAWVDVQVADHAKDGKTGDGFKGAIAAHDYSSVFGGISAL